MLQPLIGEVDAQLLEAVLVKELEPEDVQDADAAIVLLVGPELVVDSLH